MSNLSDIASELVEKIKQCLQLREFDEAVLVFRREKFSECLKNNSWDLIPLLCKDLTEEKKNEDPEFVECCEILLSDLAQKANPEETLLEFLEQAETAADHHAFKTMLKMLMAVLQRPIARRIKSIGWCLAVVQTYLENLPVPPEEGALDVVASAVQFQESFLDRTDDNSVLRSVVTSHLIQTLSCVFPYVPSDGDLERNIMHLISKLIPSPWSVLLSIRRESDGSKPRNPPDLFEDNVADYPVPFANEENETHEVFVSNFSYGMFFYHVLRHDKWMSLVFPCVTNLKFIFLTLSHTTVPLLEKSHGEVVKKGLEFLKILLNNFSGSLRCEDLCFPSHKLILTNLNKIMIFSEVKSNRKLALFCFKEYILRFDSEACYWFLVHFRSCIDHAGTLGYMITLIKEFTVHPEHSKKYFKEKLLFDLIKLYCYPTGHDIVQYSDQIISSLNLLIFVVIRDSRELYFKSHVLEINEHVVKPLQKSIQDSKVTNEVKLQDIDQNQGVEVANLNVTVKGVPLSGPNLDEQRNIVHCMNNTVALLETLLGRLLELIANTYSMEL